MALQLGRWGDSYFKLNLLAFSDIMLGLAAGGLIHVVHRGQPPGVQRQATGVECADLLFSLGGVQSFSCQ